MTFINLLSIMKEFIKVVVTSLPNDVTNALRRVCESEEGITKHVCDYMLKNVYLASRTRKPLCQDTGTLMFFIKASSKSPHFNVLKKVIVKAVKELTKEGLLRPNSIDPFTNVNTGDNTGRYIPWIEWDIVDDIDITEVTLYVAGGGSSLPARALVVRPTDGLDELVKLVFDIVPTYGINACPPLIVGIGIGATLEIAATLSKRALLKPVGARNPNPKVAKLETLLLSKLNDIGIGPQGLFGKTFVLDVHIEYSYRHPATYAIALSLSCWALRRGILTLYPEGRAYVSSHGVWLEGT